MHPILPLSLLEAVRACDRPARDVGMVEESEGSIRLGLTSTVAVQIERFTGLARRGGSVDEPEVAALFRLVARRNDAGLVFADAGRLAGRLAAARGPLLARALRRILPGRLRVITGRRLLRRVAHEVFGMEWDRAGTAVTAGNTFASDVTPGGEACGFFGSAMAELLRAYSNFEGALFHTSCRTNGGTACEWRTTDR